MYGTRTLPVRVGGLLVPSARARAARAREAVPAWQFSSDELARLDRREVLVPQSSQVNREESSFRAAIEIDAPATQVFRTMTDCTQAMRFVPHLVRCAVLETAPDGSWQIIQHEVTYGWPLPRASYVFRAAYEPSARVHFSGVRRL